MLTEVDQITDEELLKRAGQGDEGAFLELYRRHRESVIRSARRVLGGIDLVEDIVQEVFMSLFKNSNRFDPERTSLHNYLIGAARNLALYHLRKTRKESPCEQLPELPSSHEEQEQLNKLLDDELSYELCKAIDKLPPIYRNTIMLNYGGHKIAEIAAMQETNVATIKSRLLRAREQIFKQLAPYFSLLAK